MSQDYYELLGVPRSANETELKRVYRKLARELHPDSGHGDPEAEEKFKQVTLAYEVLSDPERRRRYDMFGPEGVRGSGAGGATSDPFFGASGVSDIFDALFGGRSPFGAGSPFGGSGTRRGPARGPDAEATLSIAFEEAVFGVDTELTVKIPVTCESCSGSGAQPGTSPTTCTSCQGSGEVRRVRSSILGQMVTAAPCGRCAGSGEMIADPCPTCRSEGRVTAERSFTVEVPSGVDNGATLRLTGRGPAGPRGGPAGDLYVHLSVAKSLKFTRDGYDLVHEVHVSMAQAALGTKIALETLDGDEEVKIAPGTQSGKSIRIKQRGVPHIGGRGRGDSILHIQVDTPIVTGKADEDLLRQFAALRNEEVDPPGESIKSKIRSAFR